MLRAALPGGAGLSFLLALKSYSPASDEPRCEGARHVR
jgi:hypothetical protein